MAETRVERRLAAILAADVAGYSRLMGVEEERTLDALKACRRELIDLKIAEHRGRIVKTTGDGALAEFASAAARCAMELQRAMAERNVHIPETAGSNFASVSMSATSSSTRATSTVTGSILRHGLRHWLVPARSAFQIT